MSKIFVVVKSKFLPYDKDIITKDERVYMKSWIKKILLTDQKKIAGILVVLFLIGLIPVLYLSGYVHATGDDYGYGYRAREVWLSSHSLWQVLKAAGDTVANYWNGWQGTWFTIFLMALQPEVFWDNGYWIVPWVMLGITIFTTSVLTHYIMRKKMHLSNATWLCADILVLTAMLQYFPSTKSGIFWYNGTVHYIVPYGLAMISVWACGKFTDTEKKRYWITALICMTFLGGASYLAPLFVLVVLFYLMVFVGGKKRQIFWLLIPVGAEISGLAVSYLAPGNQVRGGEEFGIHGTLILKTILACFSEGALTILDYVRTKPLIFLIFLMIGFFVYEEFRNNEHELQFKSPFIVIVMMYCLYCAMFAPGLYAGVELSGGVPNTIYQVFLLTFLMMVLYSAGALAEKQKEERKKFDKLRFRTGMCVCVFVLFGGMYLAKGTLKDTTFYKCYEYIASGQAEDYKDQMEERLAILRNQSLRSVELPAMNSDQGPLMHMEVLEDPEGWTNMVVCQFFQKDRVVQIPRKE